MGNQEKEYIAYELPRVRIIPRATLLRCLRKAPDFAVIITKNWHTYHVLVSLIEEHRKGKVVVIMTRSNQWREWISHYQVEQFETTTS